MKNKKISIIIKLLTTAIALVLYIVFKKNTSLNPVIGILIPVYIYLMLLFFYNKKNKKNNKNKTL